MSAPADLAMTICNMRRFEKPGSRVVAFFDLECGKLLMPGCTLSRGTDDPDLFIAYLPRSRVNTAAPRFLDREDWREMCRLAETAYRALPPSTHRARRA